MDPDQDILDQLDKREGPNLLSVISLIVATALIAGAVAYLTLLQQLNYSRELAADAGGLFGIAAGVGMLLAYRKFG
jgi:hypothetical protein